nr:hypothetical protein Itr_chr08CG17180 [Ipomoea trifida]
MQRERLTFPRSTAAAQGRQDERLQERGAEQERKGMRQKGAYIVGEGGVIRVRRYCFTRSKRKGIRHLRLRA